MCVSTQWFSKVYSCVSLQYVWCVSLLCVRCVWAECCSFVRCVSLQYQGDVFHCSNMDICFTAITGRCLSRVLFICVCAGVFHCSNSVWAECWDNWVVAAWNYRRPPRVPPRHASFHRPRPERRRNILRRQNILGRQNIWEGEIFEAVAFPNSRRN